jgi:cyclin-dependent kinase
MSETLKNGQYVIVEKIGAGVFGKVFKVKDTSSSNIVLAMKRVQSSNDDEIMLNEVKLLTKSTNNYIIEYIEFFRDTNFNYIVTEFIAEDCNLAKRILSQKNTGQNFSEDIVILWTNQLLRGTLNNLQNKLKLTFF